MLEIVLHWWTCEIISSVQSLTVRMINLIYRVNCEVVLNMALLYGLTKIVNSVNRNIIWFYFQSRVNIRAEMSLTTQSIPSTKLSPVTALHFRIYQWWVLILSSSRTCKKWRGQISRISHYCWLREQKLSLALNTLNQAGDMG